MVFVDHGIFRLIYLNKHKVTPNFWRAAQPSPRQIRQMAADGIHTILNLRGGREFGSWPLEKQTCIEQNLVLVDFVLRSRGAPDKAGLLELPAFFAGLNYPVLAHCKSGADRAGLMSALYLLIHEKRSVSEAARQLNWRYGHFRFAKTGVLDAFLDQYAKDGEAKGIEFLDWVENHYDPAALEAGFKTHFLSVLIADRLFRRE